MRFLQSSNVVRCRLSIKQIRPANVNDVINPWTDLTRDHTADFPLLTSYHSIAYRRRWFYWKFVLRGEFGGFASKANRVVWPVVHIDCRPHFGLSASTSEKNVGLSTTCDYRPMVYICLNEREPRLQSNRLQSFCTFFDDPADMLILRSFGF